MDASSWFPFVTFEHSLESIESEDVIIYKEEEEENRAPEEDEEEEENQALSHYIVSDLSDVLIEVLTPPPDKNDVKNGISTSLFSHSFRKCDLRYAMLESFREVHGYSK